MKIKNWKLKIEELVNKIQLPDYGELLRLSADYAPLQGMYQGITNSFAANLALRARKSEILNPKSEINSKFQIQIFKTSVLNFGH